MFDTERPEYSGLFPCHRYKAMNRTLSLLAAIGLSVMLSGCGQLISNAKQAFAEDLSAAILQHDEPETVRQALPSYLVLVDSMVRGDDRNVALLLSASNLYSSYVGVFVEDAERKKRLSERAFLYAHRALCLRAGQDNVTACNLHKESYATFERSLQKFTTEDVELLFTLGAAWAGKVQANSADWNAVAELPKVRAVIERVLVLDEHYSNGDVHLYMGVMESLLPPAMGGKPDVARAHFEKALEISSRSNSMALLFYAEKYARLVFDRELHDELLGELLALDPADTQSKLIDAIAKAKANELLAGADEYF